MIDVAEQVRHDAMHPGKRCADCPRSLAHQDYLSDIGVWLRRPWYQRIFGQRPKLYRG
jgi:hypothetical protein